MERSEELGALFVALCYWGIFLLAKFMDLEPFHKLAMSVVLVFILLQFLLAWKEESGEVVVDPSSS